MERAAGDGCFAGCREVLFQPIRDQLHQLAHLHGLLGDSFNFDGDFPAAVAAYLEAIDRSFLRHVEGLMPAHRLENARVLDVGCGPGALMRARPPFGIRRPPGRAAPPRYSTSSGIFR